MAKESNDGHRISECVRVGVGADGLLESLWLNPRSLRLGSEVLAEHIVSAVRAAQKEMAEAGDESVSENSPPDGLDRAKMLRRLDEMTAHADRGFDRLASALDEALRRLE